MSLPNSKPRSFNVAAIPTADPSPTRPPSAVTSPVCISARMNVPVVNTAFRVLMTIGSSDGSMLSWANPCPSKSTAPAPGGRTTPMICPSSNEEFGNGSGNNIYLRMTCKDALGFVPICVFVILATRTSNSSTSAAVENLEHDPSGVGDPAHHSAQGIDLTNNLALGKSTYGGIA